MVLGADSGYFCTEVTCWCFQWSHYYVVCGSLSGVAVARGTGLVG